MYLKTVLNQRKHTFIVMTKYTFYFETFGMLWYTRKVQIIDLIYIYIYFNSFI